MKLKFVTIGTGSIVEKMISGAKLSKHFSLYAVYSRSKEKAIAFQNKFDAQHVFTDLRDVAESEADVVYIASPTALHYNQAKLMLTNKKHVLCEKPACSNAKEVKELIDLAKQNGVLFLEAMRPVFAPGYKWISDNLYRVGKVRQVTFTYCQYSSRYDNFKKGIIENAFRPELSNGALMDIGVYPLHVMVSLFGMPNKIQVASYVLKNSIDGCGTAILEYDDFFGNVIYSKIADSKLPCEIQGEDGIMQFSPVGTPIEAKLILRNGKTEIADISTIEHDIFYEVDAFCKMILNGENVDNYNQVTVKTLEVMDIMRKQCNIRFPADVVLENENKL